MENKRKQLLEAYRKNFLEKRTDKNQEPTFKTPASKSKIPETTEEDDKEDTGALDVKFQLVTPAELYKASLTNMMKLCCKEICKDSYADLAYEIIEQDWLGVIVEVEDDEIEGEGDNAMKNVYGVATILKVDDYLVSLELDRDIFPILMWAGGSS